MWFYNAYIICYDKSLNEHFCHHGKDCLSKFSKTLKAQVN